MGYPMTYRRVVLRNGLTGDYQDVPYKASGVADTDKKEWLQAVIAGDLRRLEHDQRDEEHLVAYAASAGISVTQAKAVLDAFFGDR